MDLEKLEVNRIMLRAIRELTVQAEAAVNTDRFAELIAELADYTAFLMSRAGLEDGSSAVPATPPRAVLRVVK